MVKKTNLLQIYFAILCVISIVAIALRTGALLTDFNIATGYFESKGLLRAASVILGTGCVFLFTYAFTARKSTDLLATFSTPETYVPAGAAAVSIIFFAIENKKSVSDFKIALESKNITDIILWAVIILAFFATAYFALAGMQRGRSSTARAMLGLMLVLFLCIYAVYLYFETTKSRVSNNKITDQMAFILASLFFLYETRISIGRDRWNLYIAFGYIAAALSAYSSLPSLIYYFVRGELISHTLEENILMLTVSIFIFARLYLASGYLKDETCEYVNILKDAAATREAYVSEKEEILRQAFLEITSRMNEIEEAERAENENELFESYARSETESVSEEVGEELIINEEISNSEIQIDNVQYESDSATSDTDENIEADMTDEESAE